MADPPTPTDEPTPSAEAPPRAAAVILRLVTGQLTLAGALVLTGIITARVWGADARGLIAALVVWPRLMIAITQSGITKAIPVVMRRHDAERTQVARAALKVWAGGSVLATGIAAVVILTPATIAPPQDWHPWVWQLAAILMVPFGMLMPFGKGILLGLGRPGAVAQMNATQGLLNFALVATAALVLGFADPAYAYLAIVGFTFGYAANTAVLAVRFWRAGVFRAGAGVGSGDMVRQSFAMGMGGLSTELLQQMNLLMLTLPLFAVAKADIANYAVGFAFALLLRQVPQAASGLVTYRGSQDADDPAFAGMTAAVARRSLLLAVLLMIPLGAASPWLVPLVYGPEFGDAGWLVLIALPGVAAFFLSRMYEAGLAAKARPDLIVRSALPLVVVGATANAVVIPLAGIWGVAAVAAGCYVLLGISMAVRFARLTDLPITETLCPRAADVRQLGSHLQRLTRRFRRGTAPTSPE